MRFFIFDFQRRLNVFYNFSNLKSENNNNFLLEKYATKINIILLKKNSTSGRNNETTPRSAQCNNDKRIRTI